MSGDEASFRRPPVAVHTRTKADARQRLLGALPSIVALVASLILAGVLLWCDRTAWADQYEAEADRALSAGDFATARVCYERLLSEQPDSAHYRDGLTFAARQMQAPQTAR